MSIGDPIGDLITRIRNGQQARHTQVLAPLSKERLNILKVLKEEGFIADFEVDETSEKFAVIKILLKYFNGKPVINEIKRISKPGRRIYLPISKLKKIYNGLGVAIISTSKGVMSDDQARVEKVGGEVLFYVF